MIKKGIASALAIQMLIIASGCYSYAQINKESSVYFRDDDYVKITTTDDRVCILSDVKINESEYAGNIIPTHSEWLRDVHSEEISILFRDVKKIEVLQFDIALTLALIIPCAGIVGYVTYYVIAMLNMD